MSSLVFSFALSAAGLALYTVSSGAVNEWNAELRDRRLIGAADAALSESLLRLAADGTGIVGSRNAPSTIAGIEFYVQDEDLGGGVHSLTATSMDGRHDRCVQLVVRQSAPGGEYFMGIYAPENVTIAGNAILDAYDSSLGSYASQVSGDHASSGVTVMSNGSIDLGSGATIHGDASWSGSTEDHAWISGSSDVRGTFGLTTDPPELPEIEYPSIPRSGPVAIPSGLTRVLTGDQSFGQLSVDGKANLVIAGPARIVTDSFWLRGGGTLHFDTTLGPIEFYSKGEFVLASRSEVSTSSDRSADVTVYLGAEHETQYDSSPLVKFASNGQFAGTVYAPNAAVNVSSNFEFFGAVAAKWFSLASNSNFHFDSALLDRSGGDGAEQEVIAWRVTTANQLHKEGFRPSSTPPAEGRDLTGAGQ